jgi:hypothetical protein
VIPRPDIAPVAGNAGRSAADPTMTVTLNVFGRLAGSLGGEFALDLEEPCSIGDLRRRLADRFPGAGEDLLGERVRFGMGNRLVPDSHPVTEGRIDVLSPISGG